MPDTARGLKPIQEFNLSDAETVKLILNGESAVDWHRLNLQDEAQAREMLEAQEFRPDEPSDRARLERVKNEAISYLRRHLDFPIPNPVERASVEELLLLASGKGHRQVCACTILKAMHIVHHVDGQELLFTIPMSIQDVFKLVEEKVYRVIGDMLSAGYPITEFIGGRKNKDSLYTKLLSKAETVAAAVYDRLRFRIVTRTADDILPIVLYLSRRVFPFNQVIPGQSLNTLFRLRRYFLSFDNLLPLMPQFQLGLTDDLTHTANAFSGRSFRAVHFVADVPVRLPNEAMEAAPPNAWVLGPVVSVLSEFQLVDRETEAINEQGDGSHAAYKHRQRLAVMRRLKLGTRTGRPGAASAPLARSEARSRKRPV
ncbi:MAG: TIGR04552 family protein [Polyangiaceae bacterium]|jgi:uncharacterized protein (TIGR04552 family)|nr:TIGR04552 family protein [Polyangiaceae bacterium]